MELNELTAEVLSRFKGGQLEIQNRAEHYLYRGEIAEVALDEKDQLKVKFAWLAEFKDGGWVNDEDLDYSLTLWFDKEANRPFVSVEKIADDRLMIHGAPMLMNEVLVFFPPDGSKLDRAKVVGLVPVA
ncbi:MAG: hypothetical protein Q7S63_02820 [bacterium]|nr:hypothetical protein [bacterium]